MGLSGVLLLSSAGGCAERRADRVASQAPDPVAASIAPVGKDVDVDDPRSVAAEIQRYRAGVGRVCTSTVPTEVPVEQTETDPAGFERVGLDPTCASGFVRDVDGTSAGAMVSRPVYQRPGVGEILGYWLPGVGWVTPEQHSLPGYSDAKWFAGASALTG